MLFTLIQSADVFIKSDLHLSNQTYSLGIADDPGKYDATLLLIPTLLTISVLECDVSVALSNDFH